MEIAIDVSIYCKQVLNSQASAGSDTVGSFWYWYTGLYHLISLEKINKK